LRGAGRRRGPSPGPAPPVRLDRTILRCDRRRPSCSAEARRWWRSWWRSDCCW
jgi:hypothetical protein